MAALLQAKLGHFFRGIIRKSLCNCVVGRVHLPKSMTIGCVCTFVRVFAHLLVCLSEVTMVFRQASLIGKMCLYIFTKFQKHIYTYNPQQFPADMNNLYSFFTLIMIKESDYWLLVKTYFHVAPCTILCKTLGQFIFSILENWWLIHINSYNLIHMHLFDLFTPYWKLDFRVGLNIYRWPSIIKIFIKIVNFCMNHVIQIHM